MLCLPDENDLDHAARRALAEAEAEGLAGAVRLAAATAAVAALWAHIDPDRIRVAVERVAAAAGPAAATRDDGGGSGQPG